MSEDRELVDIEDVELVDEETVSVPATTDGREPMVHQIGRQALGFAMAIVAERLANITYDACLKLYRTRKYKI